MTAHAADAYFPFDGGAGQFSSESQWRDIWAFLTPGVIPDLTNECLVFADSTGLHAKVKTGQVNIKGHTGTVTVQFTLDDLASVAGLTAGLKRIDRIVARADFVNNQVVFDVLTGTPNASPVKPALTQNSSMWEIPLAFTKQLVSTDTTLAPADITDERQFCSPILDSRQYPSEAWTAWTPVVGGAWARITGTVAGTYRKIGRLVHVKFKYVVGSDTAGTGLTIGGFPFAPVNIDVRSNLNIRDASGPTDYAGRLNLDAGSTTATLLYLGVFTAPGPAFFSPITATAPVTWAVGDAFNGECFYETAS